MNTVICYYERLKSNFSEDSEKFLKIWEKSWKNNGWNPIILGESYAKQNPIYSQININSPHANFYKTDNRNWTYHRSCYLRLLAYCQYVRINGVTLYADYDVINYSFTPDILNFMSEDSILKGERCAIYLGKRGALDTEQVLLHFDKDPGEISNSWKDKNASSDMHVISRFTTVFKLITHNLITKERSEKNHTYYCQNAGEDGYMDSPLVHFDGGTAGRNIPKQYRELPRSQFVEKLRPLSNNAPKIHHLNPDMQKLFNDYSVRVSKWKNIGIDRDLPAIHCIKNGNYAIWSDSDSVPCNQSAWSEQQIIEGPGWSNPFKIEEKDEENCLYYDKSLWSHYNIKNLKNNPKTTVLEGNYVGFHSWWSDKYGHILSDNMPLLAYLKANINDSFRFLILNNPVIKNIIKALDKDFYNRIQWIDTGEIISITGDLIVPTPDHYPCIMAKNLMSYFLDWISNSVPKPVKKDKIIFYTRSGTTTERVLNLENEKKIIESLKKFLIDNKINSRLVIFSGKDENGKTMSIEEQIEVFRSANTIIGPHGTGLLNIEWCDFSDDAPIKLLEFCPGPIGYSHQVQAEFIGIHTSLRGLPIDHHIILYEPKSTRGETFVDICDFNQAIKKMLLN